MIDHIGRLNRLETLASVGLPYLAETWQTAINATIWTIDVGGTTGTVLRDITEEPYQKVILAGAANADTARLHTVHEWQLGPDTWGANTMAKLLIMEWEAKFANVADIDNDFFLMGLTAGVAATRATTNIAAFILTADALNAITDDGIGETVSAVGAPVLTNWHKYAIVAYPGIIEFWVDQAMQARHTTTDGEDLPDVNAHGMFYLPQEAAVNTGELHVGMVNIRQGVIL
jgi:hypothetical protein